MSSPLSFRAAENLAKELNSLGIDANANAVAVENNDWLAKVVTTLGAFSVYTNAKGKVSVLTNFIKDPKNKDRALWALEQINARAKVESIDSKTWIAYTDGSAQRGECGWAMVMFGPDGCKEYEKFGNLGPQPNAQIAGEVEGAIYVIRDAVEKKMEKVVLRHDYEGVGKWASGCWRNKDHDATRLKKWAGYARDRGVEIEFQWTRGHNGDAGNERADELASKATMGERSVRVEDPLLKPKIKGLGVFEEQQTFGIL
jgi:ribonuclease HI